VSLDHLREREAPIDDRSELAGLRQLGEEVHILGALGSGAGDDALLARQRHPRSMEQRRQVTEDEQEATLLLE
jgi:hypothetical protein